MSDVSESEQVYMTAFRGSFTSALRWHHLDDLWQRLREQPGTDWYVYAIGEAPPLACADREQFHAFIQEMDLLLRQEHDEEYCGIVYADNLKEPGFIKIYDPNNLGVSCGYSDNPPLPGWVLSKLKPCDIPAVQVLAANRKRWWRRIFN
ncbi:MAG: hypothetical protein RPU42_06680 [Candidatus Sedimenticola sp. (ex Thyasira tokunagai)]